MLQRLAKPTLVEAEQQLRELAQLNLRETHPRSVAFAAICVTFLLAGHFAVVAGLAVLFSGFDLCRWYLTRRIAACQTGDIRTLDFYQYFALEVILRSLFAAIGLYAATSNNISVILSGAVWISGCLFIVSVNYSKIPIFYGANIAPILAATVAFVFLVGWQELRPPTAYEWLMPAITVLILFKSAKRLVAVQKNTHVLLDKAQAEAEESYAKLQFIADHDDLTGLLNRAAFTRRLDKVLAQRAKSKQPFGFILFDLDGFKPINDSFGHAAGDAVLREVSARLINAVGRNGFVARVGGDEFAATLPKITQEDELEDTAHDLIRLIQLPIPFNGTELAVGASLGGLICTDNQNSPEKILAAADAALYKAKENPKSTYLTYSSDMDRNRVSIEDRAEIEDAIRRQLILPFYQPKFRLDTMEIVGFEALARWPYKPEKPSDTAHFISLIENLGLLGDFTYHMARQVFSDVRRMRQNGLDPGDVSLNVPEATLATISGIEDFQWLMAEYRDIVGHITFEITEDVFITRAGSMILENIAAPRDQGVRISLDDFGTGFASFQHLRQLPFDELKIDTAFVAGLGHDPTVEVIVDGFLTIARGIEVSVVAEGVETEAQRQHLRQLGCKTAQGFLLSKAVSFERACDMLEGRAETKARA